MQVGFGWSAALGSGLVVVRSEQGDWSPPSALDMLSVGWGLQAGGALHDLLIVLRNRQAIHSHTQCTDNLHPSLGVFAPGRWCFWVGACRLVQPSMTFSLCYATGKSSTRG